MRPVLTLTGDAEPTTKLAPRRKPIANGYAAKPGTGPAGETCRTCAHAVLREAGGGRYWKCALVPPTRGLGTDIRLKSPACGMWKKR